MKGWSGKADGSVPTLIQTCCHPTEKTQEVIRFMSATCYRTAMTAECDSGFHRIKDVFNLFFVCVWQWCFRLLSVHVCQVLIEPHDKHERVCVS